MNLSFNIIISGGGTGGHIYPAISIAQSIQEINPHTNILFVGAHGRMEMKKVPYAGFQIQGINMMGLQRKITLKNFLLPYYILKSIQQVKQIFQVFKPDAVIGTGGYVSFPVVYTAQIKHIPNYIQEQNAFAGLANKILAKRSNKIFVAFDKMEKFFPKEKIIVSGNPVRQDLHNIQEKKQYAHPHFHMHTHHPVVLILGGSLGAQRINETIAQNIDFFIQNNIQLIWQMGTHFYANISNELKTQLQKYSVYYKDFIYEMDLAYAASDVIISRAGASTIAELALVEKPVILIPSPHVTNNHQMKNALALSEKNAALLIPDHQVPTQLIPALQKIIKDKELQQTLSANIKKWAKPHAAKTIAQYILNDLYKIYSHP